MYIGVIGCLPELPGKFPLEMPENSGNMIHANAPLELYSYAVHSTHNSYKFSGERSFKDFVNSKCSHLVVTLANTLSLDKPDGEKYVRFRRSLEQYEVPIVVFGLGIQAKHRDLENASLCPEAVELLQYLSHRAEALGVRGEFTKSVIEKCCGIKNVFVTGCPSLFSKPQELLELQENCKLENLSGRPSFNVTNMGREDERLLLARGISHSHFLVEPVSKFMHKFHLELMKGGNPELPELPYFLNGIRKRKYYNIDTVEEIFAFYQRYYRLFRTTKEWYTFNKECVAYTYGTRFHVNMASILSGKPALWLTHDARTKELVEFCNLPSIPLSEAVTCSEDEIVQHIDYSDFFNKIGSLFDNFNEYLSINGLEKVQHEFTSH
ncbi:polysaccharide pyruvyl transferase family protein [Microbulbifer sp. HZ11]|uniref:polysaccharide pyruvyl transferase family protein n=1 Tax=Microbulbifer sp. HZ11 TaxID=1453501 RepID=UPI000AB42C24|nr:polysaccharide pyruvyl transferase family protein [Microbulbifer sp. HZ11]